VTPTETLTATELISPTNGTDIPAAETEITATGEITATEELTATETPTTTGDISPGAGADASPTVLTATPVSGEAVVVEGVSLTLPPGWRQAEPGDTFHGLALQEEDLTTAAPQGPRFGVLSPELAEAVLAEGLGGSAGEVLEVFEEAGTLLIGEWEATTIGLQENIDGQTVNRRYVYITAPDGQAYELILEAPVDQWEEHLPTLEGILASLQFAASE
jgi:hypothetical protein